MCISFLAGANPLGSVQRMALRFAMNVLLAAIIVFVAGDFSYSIEGLLLDGSMDITSPYASMEVRIPRISMILLAVPALSCADAVLEFLQHRERPEQAA